MSHDSELPPALRFDNQFCFPLYSAANAVVRAYRPYLDPLDLTYLQYIVMMVLWEKDGISVGELGDKLHLDSGTLTPLLKRLEAKGLLQRHVSARDERVKLLHLTKEGKALSQQAKDIPLQVLCDTGAGAEQLNQLKQQCEVLLQRLEKA
ncbi:MAG: MarR family transcriptional regulator [Oleiphilaceae bacterium]|nr:MarR family transcriptional regulator [Oleiphilaceae bacterium]